MQILSRPATGVRLPVHSTQRRRGVLVVRAEPATAEQAPAAASNGSKKAKVEFHMPKHVEFGQEMCLIGATEEMGAWKAEKCIPMAWNDGDVWTAEADVPAGTRVEYKYIVRVNGGEEIEWQPCNNLELELPEELPTEKPVVVQDSWEGQQHSVLVGDSELPVPAAAPAEATEGTDAPVAAAAEEVVQPTVAVEKGKDTAATTTTTAAAAAAESNGAARAAGPVMDKLSAAVTDDMPVKGVETAVEAPAPRKAAQAAPAPAAGVGSSSKSENGKKPVVAAAAAAAAAPPSNGNLVQGLWQALRNVSRDASDVQEAAEEAAGDDDGLEKLSVAELKTACKAAGITAVNGKRKEELIARLREQRAQE